jgi:hypothetical protein
MPGRTRERRAVTKPLAAVRPIHDPRTSTADVNNSGTLASVGARTIEGTANNMIGQTFGRMKSKLEAKGLT